MYFFLKVLFQRGCSSRICRGMRGIGWNEYGWRKIHLRWWSASLETVFAVQKENSRVQNVQLSFRESLQIGGDFLTVIVKGILYILSTSHKVSRRCRW